MVCYNSLLQRDVRAQMCGKASRTGDFVRVVRRASFQMDLSVGLFGL